MNTSGREHGFLLYDFKMAEVFRGRSNKCNIVAVEIKKCDLRCYHSSTDTEDGTGWISYITLHKVTWFFCFSSFYATVSSCIKTINRMGTDARLLCTTNHIQHSRCKIKLLQVGCDQRTQWTKEVVSLFTVRLALWNPSVLYCFVLAHVQALWWSSQCFYHRDKQPYIQHVYVTVWKWQM